MPLVPRIPESILQQFVSILGIETDRVITLLQRSRPVELTPGDTLFSQGDPATAIYLIKFRGGDEMAYRAMNKHIINNGAAFTSQIVTPSRVKSTETLSIYLKSMHINNNL